MPGLLSYRTIASTPLNGRSFENVSEEALHVFPRLLIRVGVVLDVVHVVAVGVGVGEGMMRVRISNDLRFRGGHFFFEGLDRWRRNEAVGFAGADEDLDLDRYHRRFDGSE